MAAGAGAGVGEEAGFAGAAGGAAGVAAGAALCASAFGAVAVAAAFAVRIDHGHDGLNRHRLAFGNFDFLQNACRRGRNFRIDFVGGNFKKRFVAVDLVAGLLQPLGDGAFKNALAHLGHDDVYSHGYLLGFGTS